MKIISAEDFKARVKAIESTIEIVKEVDEIMGDVVHEFYVENLHKIWPNPNYFYEKLVFYLGFMAKSEQRLFLKKYLKFRENLSDEFEF